MDFGALVNLVDRCLYHSHLANGYFVSSLHVKIPILGNTDHVISIERSLVAPPDPAVKNELENAATVIGREVNYLLQAATQWQKPVTQQNENGETAVIGQAVVLIDRSRIGTPRVVDDNGVLYLDITN